MGQQWDLIINFDWGFLLRSCKMQISNDDQKKDTPIKSYDQISFFDNLQCKTNSFGAVLLWVFKFKKMWCQDCAAMVKKIYKIPKKVILGHPATECYWMICTILRMPIIPDVQPPRDQDFEELRRAVGLHGRLVSTGEKNRRVGKKWCQVFWEMKCLTP